MEKMFENLVILQARMSSSRLPGKVLMDLHGEPMIVRQLERVQSADLIDGIVVATSLDETDQILVEVVEGAGTDCVRGPLSDVFQRFQLVTEMYPAKNIIRLTGDCPLIDPSILTEVVAAHQESGADYTSNTISRTFPRGLDVECFTAEAFKRLAQVSLSDEEKEHVTLGFHNRRGQFSRHSFEGRVDNSEHRWTVDYPEDIAFVRSIYSMLYDSNPNFDSKDIFSIFEQNPELARFETAL